MKKEIKICDKCQSQKNVESLSIHTFRYTDAAGSGDWAGVQIELCLEHLVSLINHMLQYLSESQREEIVRKFFKNTQIVRYGPQ